MSQHQEQLFSADRNSSTGSAGPCNLSAPRLRFKPVRIKDLLDRLESDEEDTEPHDSNSDSDTEDLQMLPADDDSICDDMKTFGSDDAKLPVASNTNHLEEVPCNKVMTDTLETNGSKEQLCKISPENINKCHFPNQLSSNANIINNIVNTTSMEKINTTRAPTNVSTDRQKSKHDVDLDVISQTVENSYEKQEVNQHFLSDAKFSGQQSNYNFHLREPMENKYSKILPQIPSHNAIKSEDVHTDARFQGAIVPVGTETPMKQIAQISYRSNPCLPHKQTLSTPQTKPLGNHVNSGIETPGVILSHWSHHNLFQSPSCNSIALSTDSVGHFPQVQQKLFTPRHYPSEANQPRKPLMEAQHLNVNKNASECQNNHLRQHSNSVKRLSGLPRVFERPRDLPGRVYLTQHEFHNLESKKPDNDENKFLQISQENHPKHQTVLQKKSDSPRNGTNVNWQENFEKRNSHSSSYGKSHNPSEEQADYPAIMNQNHDHDSKISPKEFPSNEDRWEKRHSLEPSPELESHVQNNDSDLNYQSSSSRSSLPNTDDSKINSQLSVTTEKPNSNEKKDIPRNVQISIASDVCEANRGKIMVVKDNEYLVLGKLGQGMSGEVLRVQDMSSGELRAIKCVNLSRIDKETAQGCLEEVSMLHKLQAPCIITMHTYEIRGPMLYVVMEMGDTDLNRLLKSISKEKQLPLTMILYYWTEMLTAVKHIHDNGVIHSDLKPANFLLVRGRLKLIDFGIASSLNADMTSVVKNSSMGTLNYISPEAIMDIGGDGDSTNADNKYKINYKSDVWSLGCILYSLVYGQTPFQHIRAHWAKVNAITNSKSKIAFAPTENLIKCGYTAPPPFLVDVLRRCLQHDPRARPTVNQLLGISYVGCGCTPVSNLPKISPSILAKIKRSLDENEWRQLIEILETRK